MGQLIEVKCTECDYSANFVSGVGFADSTLEAVATKFEEDITKHILYISKTFSVDNYQYEMKIAFCNNCQSVQSIPVITVEYNKNSRFSHGISCKKCGEDHTFITPIHEVCTLKCPKCKANSLYNCGFGLWD